jgi:hypothetical protein
MDRLNLDMGTELFEDYTDNDAYEDTDADSEPNLEYDNFHGLLGESE